MFSQAKEFGADVRIQGISNCLSCALKSHHKFKQGDHLLNPLGSKSGQQQFSPNNISRSSTVKVMRITKLITKGRML